MVGTGRHSGQGGASGWWTRSTAGRPPQAQLWLARAFFLRFASLRFRFTDGFS
jgi:hypothetical protein